jgi:hypothetical protein
VRGTGSETRVVFVSGPRPGVDLPENKRTSKPRAGVPSGCGHVDRSTGPRTTGLPG